jgi:hypothetical protein
MMRFIAIATPSYDGNVSIEYASSLAETKVIGKNLGYVVHNFFYTGEAIVQSARNKLFSMINSNIYECVIFIDSDISWNPEDIFKLVNDKNDVVGATYRKKSDVESYVFNGNVLSTKGKLFEVDNLGFGFIKLSREAINKLWISSEQYSDDGIQCKNIFEVIVKDGQMYSEDIVACSKIKNLGFKIYLDKTINLTHSGKKNFVGDFYEWSKNI